MIKKMIAAAALATTVTAGAHASITFDDNVTNNVIMGSGITNGSWSIFRYEEIGLELGLRAKVRFNEAGVPENTFNSDGAGTYTFDAGSAVGQPANVANWSYEWSINTDYNGNGSTFGDIAAVGSWQFTLGLDIDPTAGQNFQTFDFFGGTGAGFGGFAFGDNSTPQSGGTGINFGNVSAFLDSNLAQNSMRYDFNGFDGTGAGQYDMYLTASDIGGGRGERSIGTVSATVVTSAIPEPATWLMMIMGFGLVGVASRRRKAIAA